MQEITIVKKIVILKLIEVRDIKVYNIHKKDEKKDVSFRSYLNTNNKKKKNDRIHDI